MAAPTTAAEYVVMRRPSLSGDTRVPDLISMIEDHDLLSETLFGTKHFMAVGLACLHMVQMSEAGTGAAGGNADGASGAVISQTAGRLSRSYDHSVISTYASSWNTTSWGMELLLLARQCGGFMARTRMG